MLFRSNNNLKYKNSADSLPEFFIRKSSFLNQKVFNSYFSETEIMRYMKLLERRDISLTQSMIPLGSCTMKLNAASEMFALSYDGFTNIHPMAPSSQTKGYNYVITKLGEMLCEITGMASISFQPNSGSAGEYAGLKVIKAYHHDIGESQRNIVLIPASAHGTNPASAAMCGYSIIEVKCRENGDISLEDLEIKEIGRAHV